MRIFIRRWKLKKIKLIKKLSSRYGSLPAKGFPGRAAILIKLLGLGKNQIKCVYEQNKSIKVGYYVPGTRIPILPDKQLNKINKNVPLINLAWHINKEIKSYLKKNNVKNRVVDILSQNDFSK